MAHLIVQMPICTQVWLHQDMIQTSCRSSQQQLLRPPGHESSESEATHMECDHMQSELQPNHSKRRAMHGSSTLWPLWTVNTLHHGHYLSILYTHTSTYQSLFSLNIYIPKGPLKIYLPSDCFRRAIRACPTWAGSSSPAVPLLVCYCSLIKTMGKHAF